MADRPAIVLEPAASELVAVTTVRYDGTVNDFMPLNSLTGTRATRASVDQATSFLRAALGTT